MKVKVVVVAPAEGTQGGISAVIANYKCAKFWARYNCRLYSTSIESASRLYELLYQIKQLFGFFFIALIQRPRVASIHTASRNSFYRSFFYIVISRLVRMPVVLHVHPAYFFEFYRQGGWTRKMLIRVAGRLSAKIVFLTPSIRDLFLPIFPDKQLLVVANPVNVSQFARDEKSPDRNPRQLLFMGWIVREKGVYDIVDVIPDVIEEVPEARFIFAGNKEVERLRRMIEERGLTHVANVVGWVTGREKLDLLLGSGALLLPSYSEGVPNVILEAMASGLPVITTPVGGIPSVVKEGVSGLFVKPGDKDSLRAAILTLLRDEGLCERMSAEAQRIACELYDVEEVGAKLEEIYGAFVE